MSGTTMGLVLGVLVGLGNARILWKLSRKYPVLQSVALVEIVVMTVIGWLLGAYVFEGNV